MLCRTRGWLKGLVLAAVVLLSAPAQASIIYVDDDPTLDPAATFRLTELSNLTSVASKPRARQQTPVARQAAEKVELFIESTDISRDCTPPDVAITINILTDDFGDETSWQVVNHDTGTAICAVPEYTYDSNTLYEEECCVDPNGCYDFIIYDVYGDGICCECGFAITKSTTMTCWSVRAEASARQRPWDSLAVAGLRRLCGGAGTERKGYAAWW